MWGEHVELLQRRLDEGSLILAGPTLGPVNTGICVFEAPDEAAGAGLHGRGPDDRQRHRDGRAAAVPRLVPARALAAAARSPASAARRSPSPSSSPRSSTSRRSLSRSSSSSVSVGQGRSPCQWRARLECCSSTRASVAWPFGRPVIVTVRSSSGSPPALDWSSVPFHSSTSIAPSGPRAAQPSTSVPAPSPSSVQRQQVVAELLGQRQRPPARLAQVADGQQAEAAVQQRGRAAELLEVVADDPVGERVGAAPARTSCRAAGRSR